MTAEDRDVALGGFRERHLIDLDALALEILQREIIDAAEAERRHFQSARLLLRGLLEVGPGLEGAVLCNEDEGRALQHDRDGLDVLGLPAGVLAGEERVAVGDVDGHGVAVGGRGEELGHAGAAGGAGHVDDREGGTDDRLKQLAGQARELIGTAARTPGYNVFDRTRRILLVGGVGGRR